MFWQFCVFLTDSKVWQTLNYYLKGNKTNRCQRFYSVNGLFHLISASPPRLRTDLSLLPLSNSVKKCCPLKTSLKNGFTPEEFHKKKVFTPEEFHEISVYPWRFPLIIWVLPLKNSSAFGLYPWRIPPLLSLTPEEFHCSSTGGGCGYEME